MTTNQNQTPQNPAVPEQPANAQGIPSVASRKTRSKLGSQVATALILALAVGIGVGIFVWMQAQKGEEAPKQDNAPQLYTSRKELTRAPLAPKVDPVNEMPVLTPPMQEPAQLNIIEEPSHRAMLIGQTPDKPKEPTLWERKFAAPLMGEVKEQMPAVDTSMDNSRPPARDGGKLGAMLSAVETPPVQARAMGDRSLTLPKGTFIDCVLETRLNTTVPGMTSCIVPRDIYSANGKVLLIERGSKAVGEYKGSVENGLDRIFVLWTEIQTPKGVRVNLDSPGADALGGSGLEGHTDYHWWARFGNALLFSLIQDGFDYIIQKDSENNGGVSYYQNSQDGMEEIIKEAMRQSGNIPPTLTKNQGDRIGIFVARDLDFSSVYKLKSTTK